VADRKVDSGGPKILAGRGGEQLFGAVRLRHAERGEKAVGDIRGCDEGWFLRREQVAVGVEQEHTARLSDISRTLDSGPASIPSRGAGSRRLAAAGPVVTPVAGRR
jgi:hypothetical protein